MKLIRIKMCFQIITIYNVVLCLILFLFAETQAKIAPDYIHPCNSTTRECLVKATQHAVPELVKGIPELGIEPLDPFFLGNLEIPLSGLKVTFYQMKVTGLKKCIVENVVLELEKRHFVMEFHCNVTIKGRYGAVGRLLLFQVNSEGDAKVKLINTKVKIDLNTKYIKQNGINFFDIENYKYDFDYGDRIMFDLKNIFKESKELSDTILTFFNENWKTVSEEFGKPFMDKIVDLVIQTLRKFLLAVPYEELVHVPLPNKQRK